MVQEVTTRSWGRRILNAFWGVLFGLVLLIGAFVLIFWNEGHALHTEQALEQTAKQVISVAAAPIDPKNELQVIYVSGLASTNDILSDKTLMISEKAIQLHRKVDMYQWEEEVETHTEKQVGGSEQEIKSYSYKKTWSPELLDSSAFKEQAGHENPAAMPFKSTVQYATKVSVGDFSLPRELITQMTGEKPVPLDLAKLEALKARFNKPLHLQEEGLYIGEDEQAPKIGDLRVTVTAVYPGTVSIIAQQKGKTLQPYRAQSGHAVSLIEMGQVSPEQMIEDAKAENRLITWLLRLLSLAMLIIGLALIMSPLAVLADFLPFLGSLVGLGTGFIAFTLGFCLWLIAIAIAWFVARPIVSIILIAAAAVSVFGFVSYRKRGSQR